MIRLLNILPLVFFFSVSLCSWAQDHSGKKEAVYYENHRLDYNLKTRSKPHRGLTIVEGDKLVFDLNWNNDGDPGNASLAPGRFAFEVNGAQKKFELSGDALMKKNAFYGHLCHCEDGGFQHVIAGTINGKKLSNGHWQINMDVTVKGDHSGKTYHLDQTIEYAAKE